MSKKCLCGCGSTISDTASFKRGHQIRFKNKLINEVRVGNFSVLQDLVRFNWLNDEVNAVVEEVANLLIIDENSFNRTFGVEIEFLIGKSQIKHLKELFEESGLGFNILHYTHEVFPYWKLVTDASLIGSGNLVGRELVSPILEGVEGIRELLRVFNILNKVGVQRNETCAIHVHIGVKDLKEVELGRVYCKYGKDEREFFDKLFPKFRAVDNRYTMSCTDYKELEKCLNKEEELKNSNLERDTEYYLYSTRYKKVNTLAYKKYKTVEFREMETNFNPVDVINWIKLLQFFISKVQQGEEFSMVSMELPNPMDKWVEDRKERVKELNSTL